MHILHLSTIPHPAVTDLIEAQKEDHTPIYIDVRFGEEDIRVGHTITTTWNPWSKPNLDFDTHLQEVIKEVQPDIIHLHFVQGLSLQNTVKNRGIKTILTLHDHSFFCLKGTNLDNNNHVCETNLLNCGHCGFLQELAQRSKTTLQEGLQQRKIEVDSLTKHLHKIICPTKSIKKRVDTLTNNQAPTEYIPHTIPTPPQAEKTHSYDMGFAGSLSFIKGAYTLMEAIKQLPKNIQFLFALQTEFVETEQEVLSFLEAQPNITIKKDIPHHMMYEEFYRHIDRLLLPSLFQETGPLVLLEAFALQIPVVASDMDSIKEKVRPEKNALLFEAGNAEHLAETVQKSMQFPFSKESENYRLQDLQKYIQILYKT